MIQLTSIAVKDDTWKELNKLKSPGDTMDDVIKVLLKNYQQKKDKWEDSFMSEEEFNALLDALEPIPDDYLEKSRESFAREVKE